MAKRKQQVQVKSYRRKDGTVVRSSNRAVLTVGKDVRKEKRQNKLGNYLKTGAKIGGALGGAVGGLSGAAAGGMVLGPAGALAGAGIYGASGALGGGISGAGYGAATYATRKKFAKDKSKRNFDYTRENNMYEFARKKGARDRFRRKRNTLGGHMKKGAAALGTLGAVGGAARGIAASKMMGVKGPAAGLAALGGAAVGALDGAVKGTIGGGAVYGARKAFAKDRSKRNFDYSRININTGDFNQIMFIGQIEKEGYSYDFARKRGSKDRKARQRRGSALGKAAKLAGGAAAIGATGLALKNAPKAIKTGMRAAKSARGSLLGQNSTNKLFGVGAGLKTAGASLGRNMGKDVRKGAGAVARGAENLRAKTARAGYSAADRVGAVAAGGANRVKKGVKKARNAAELRVKGSRQLNLFD